MNPSVAAVKNAPPQSQQSIPHAIVRSGRNLLSFKAKIRFGSRCSPRYILRADHVHKLVQAGWRLRITASEP